MSVLTSKNLSRAGLAEQTAKAFAWLWADPDRADADFWQEKSTDRQRELRWAMRDARQTSCASANGQGKTHTIAKCLVEFILANYPAYGICTSASWTTLNQTLLPQFRHRVNRARELLAGVPLDAPSQREWWPMGQSAGRWAVLSISPSEPENAAGRHNDRVMVVVDEASGINPKILTAIQGITTRPADRLVLSGNPLEDSGSFYDSHNRNKSAWSCITMDAMESPNVIEGRMVFPGMSTREWVNDRREEWGEDSPEFQARVRGRFPVEGSMTIITRKMIEDAIARYSPDLQRKGRMRMGVDVAYAQRGDWGVWIAVDDVAARHWDAKRGLGSVAFEGMTKSHFREWGVDEGFVDDGGLAGLGDRLADEGIAIEGCMGGAKSFDEENFANVKTECLWRFREWLLAGGAIPPDLGAKLLDECGLQYKVLRSGKKQAETREEIIERVGHSIDYTSAFGLALRRRAGESVFDENDGVGHIQMGAQPLVVPVAGKSGLYGLRYEHLIRCDEAVSYGVMMRGCWWNRRGESGVVIVHRADDGTWTVPRAELVREGVGLRDFCEVAADLSKDVIGKFIEFDADVYSGVHDADRGEVFYGDILAQWLERSKGGSAGTPIWVDPKYIEGMAGMDAIMELVKGTKLALGGGAAREMLCVWPSELVRQIGAMRYKPESRNKIQGEDASTDLIGGGGGLVRCLRLLLVSRLMKG